ncbi:class I SAM-dependent methyltransferase, partial [Arthrospira platensis SPKY2]
MKWFFAFNEEGPKFQDFAKMVKVAVATAQEKTSLEPFCIYDGSENDLTSWLKNRKVNLIFHRTPHYDRFKNNMVDQSFRTACGAYLRVEIPKIIEQYDISDEYVLYTDCDVLFVNDVVDYLKSLQCRYFGAVPEPRHSLKPLNSGVLYLNVKKMQEVYNDFNDLIKSRNGMFPAFDQGAYNQFFENKWDQLDISMNWRSYWEHNPNAKVLHFHGPKPTQVEAIKNKTIPPHQRPLVNQNFWSSTKLWTNKYQELLDYVPIPNLTGSHDQLKEISQNLIVQSSRIQELKEWVSNHKNNKNDHKIAIIDPVVNINHPPSPMAISNYQNQDQVLEADKDTTCEPHFLEMLYELNQVIASTNIPLEGNICYPNRSERKDFEKQPPSSKPHLRSKRKNMITLTRNRRRMLEIGLNGGHSALIALYNNPQLEFHSVDICRHKYTELAADFLKQKYPNRFYFYKGDSRDILPQIAIQKRHIKFDIIHVDGGHGIEVCRTDISNSIRLSS